MNKKERQSRVIARGEQSNHSHVITGDAQITTNSKNEVIITVGNAGVVLKHIKETAWVESGAEVWTEEHHDVPLKDLPDQVRQGDVLLDKVGEREYKFIQQQEYDPYEDAIRDARD